MASGSFTTAAKLVGLSSASFLSAWIASFSFISVPAIQMAPADLGARQWSKIFHIGANSAPPFAIACSACFAFLAYETRKIKGRFPIRPAHFYGAAAILAPCIVPYTQLVMWSGIQALESKALGLAGAPTDAQVEGLIAVWTRQNFNRSLMVAAAGILSVFAMLS